MRFHERFESLDPAVWTSSYLPAWSSRAEAAATYDVGAAGLTLSIPADQGLWCADLHETPLRVSAIHSANRSGPVGSTDAPQPFREGLRVTEAQPTMLGFTPHFGTVAVTCSAGLTPRSMFSAWLVGLEDRPERCGEICLMEIFGNSVADGRAAIGQGIHPFRDPALREEFDAPSRPFDAEQSHVYAVEWSGDGVRFSIDGAVTKVSEQSPDYPMMLILGLFDFPDADADADADADGDPHDVPWLRVTEVTGEGLRD